MPYSIYTLRNLGSKGDMSVDLGAYRYIDGQHTLTQGIIENLLKLPYNLYDPISQTFRVIKDPATGNNAGYVAFVEGLLKNAVQAGLKLFFNYGTSARTRREARTVSL